MQTLLDFRSTRKLEQFLQDLICVVASPEEVGVLVEVLMAMQVDASRRTVARTKVASA
jgi:hypothetical protein